jgi:AcrR family transcriptional regulator
MRAAIEEHGYSDASVAEVIKRAGVSRKTFYAQFADKEDCFLSIYDDCMGRLQAVTRDAFDAQDDWVPALRAGLTALLNGLAYDPAVAKLCFVDVLAAGPRAAEARNLAMRELEAILELGRGGGAAADGDAGESASAPAMPSALGRSMVGGLGEVLYQEIIAGRAEQLPTMLPELMYAMVLPFEGREAAERELNRTPRRSTSVAQG